MTNFIGFEEAIKQYLDELAKTDKLFAKTYAKENKSVEECCNYIIAEVQKLADGQQGVASKDSGVYQLAVHYYDEDNIKVPAKVEGVKVVVLRGENKPSDTPKEEKPKQVEEPKEEKPKCKTAKEPKAEKPKQVEEPKQETTPKAKPSIEDYELDIPIF